MGLFRPYERSTDQTEATGKDAARLSSLTPKTPTPPAESGPARTVETPAAADAGPKGHEKKGGATRTRKQAEAERMERLHPTLTPREQRKADKNARATARLEAFDRAEQLPERVLLRDYLDSRWTINEFMLPAMIVVMAATMATMNNVALSTYIALGLWVLLIMAVINTWFMWSGFKKLLAQRHPNANRRGLLMYLFNRSIMIRRFRRPAPRIARGEFS